MESEQEFRKQLWALRNPSKPLPKSDEAKKLTKENLKLEQSRAECKMLLRRKKAKAVAAAVAQESDGEEAEEENIYFPE